MQTDARCLVLAALLALPAAGCKPNKTASSVQSLDNFANGGALHANQCAADPASRPAAGALTNRVAYFGTQAVANKAVLSAAVGTALSAVPGEIQSLLAQAGLVIMVTDTTQAVCNATTLGNRALSAQFNTSKPIDQDSCLTFDTRTKPAQLRLYLAPDAKLISHELVKSMGFSLIEFVAGMQVDRAKNSVNVSGALAPSLAQANHRLGAAFVVDMVSQPNQAWANLLDSFLGPGATARLKQNVPVFNKSQNVADLYAGLSFKTLPGDTTLSADDRAAELLRFEDYVFAESFDSYYCNTWAPYDATKARTVLLNPKAAAASDLATALQNTRSVMRDLFPNTYAQFAVLAPTLAKAAGGAGGGAALTGSTGATWLLAPAVSAAPAIHGVWNAASADPRLVPGLLPTSLVGRAVLLHPPTAKRAGLVDWPSWSDVGNTVAAPFRWAGNVASETWSSSAEAGSQAYDRGQGYASSVLGDNTFSHVVGTGVGGLNAAANWTTNMVTLGQSQRTQEALETVAQKTNDGTVTTHDRVNAIAQTGLMALAMGGGGEVGAGEKAAGATAEELAAKGVSQETIDTFLAERAAAEPGALGKIGEAAGEVAVDKGKEAVVNDGVIQPLLESGHEGGGHEGGAAGSSGGTTASSDSGSGSGAVDSMPELQDTSGGSGRASGTYENPNPPSSFPTEGDPNPVDSGSSSTPAPDTSSNGEDPYQT